MAIGLNFYSQSILMTNELTTQTWHEYSLTVSSQQCAQITDKDTVVTLWPITSETLPDDNVFHSKQDLSSHSAVSQGRVSHIWNRQNAAKTDANQQQQKQCNYIFIKYMQNCLSYHLCWLLLAVELSDIQINVMKHLIIIILLKLTLVSIRVSIQR